MTDTELVKVLQGDAKWVKRISWQNAPTGGSAEFLKVSGRIVEAATRIEQFAKDNAKLREVNEMLKIEIELADKMYADLVADSKRLQAEIDRLTAELLQIGMTWDDSKRYAKRLEALLAGYKQVKADLADAIESCDMSDAANTALEGALAASQRREQAAVECIHKIDIFNNALESYTVDEAIKEYHGQVAEEGGSHE